MADQLSSFVPNRPLRKNTMISSRMAENTTMRIQRVDALNLFLADIYHDKRIVRDGVLPSEFLYASKGYLPECEGVSPPADIYSHISGIDLV